jgi:hypothetical protein
VGELAGESLAGQTQRFDAEGEWIVAAGAGNGDGDPVRVERFDRGGDGVVAPPFGVLEVVMATLVALEAFDSVLGPGDDAGGVDPA